MIQPLSEFFGKEFEVAWQDNPNGATVYTPSKGSWRTLIWIPTGYLEKVNECEGDQSSKANRDFGIE